MPFFSVIAVLLLLFIGFIFFEANENIRSQGICTQREQSLNLQCAVSKDGNQICGSEGIRKLCKDIEYGFYCIFMGTILMAGLQVRALLLESHGKILLITTACLRRYRVLEDNKFMEKRKSRA